MPRKRKYYPLDVIEKFMNQDKGICWISLNVFGKHHSTFSVWMRDNVIIHKHKCIYCNVGITYTLQLKHPREAYNQVAEVIIGKD